MMCEGQGENKSLYNMVLIKVDFLIASILQDQGEKSNFNLSVKVGCLIRACDANFHYLFQT